jgi:two-component system KDP operon response regulator KdpE
MSPGEARVLVVDDEPQIVRGLRVILSNAGYKVEQATTKQEALDAVSVRPPDAIVLDLVLPDGSGLDVATEIRRWSQVPIVVLSAVGDEQQKVLALDAGADDYVTKPFGSDELLARMRAVLRRRTDDGDSTVKVGELEFDLLSKLAEHPGRLVTHRQLLHEVWGPGYEDETHYLRVHFAHVRSKLEPDPSNPTYVITEPGIGYRLRAEG